MSTKKFESEDHFIQDATIEQSAFRGEPAILNTTLASNQILLGQYEVARKLGQGGMSTVFLCRHIILNELVAIKLLLLERAENVHSLNRLRQEAKATFKLNHPNIIRLLDFRYDDTYDGAPCIVMEYVEGKSLDEILVSEGTLDFKRFVRIFSQVCDGLEHAHENGVVHRDLKPSNLMIRGSANDETELVKIVDFGIAKVIEKFQSQQLTKTGEVFGSPLYMSPEQCKGMTPDRRSDLYSLGCAMFESLTGVPPYRGDNSIQTLFMHVDKPIPALKLQKSASSPETAIAIENIVQKLLSKDPSQRFQSANALKSALIESLTAESGPSKRVRNNATSKSLAFYLSSVICAVLILFSVVIFVLHNLAEDGQKSAAVKTFKPEEQTEPQKPTEEVTPGRIEDQAKAARKVQILLSKANELTEQQNFAAAIPILQEAYGVTRGLQKHDLNRRAVILSYSAALFIGGNEHTKQRLHTLFPQVEDLLDDEPRVPNNDQSNIYGWHGIIQYYAGKYDDSIRLLDKAIALSSVKTQQAQWFCSKGDAWARSGNMLRSDDCYKLARSLLGVKYPIDTFHLLCSRAFLHIQCGDPKGAIESLKEGKKMVESGLIPKSSPQYPLFIQMLQDEKLSPPM